jgi:hypothetical protein
MTGAEATPQPKLAISPSRFKYACLSDEKVERVTHLLQLQNHIVLILIKHDDRRIQRQKLPDTVHVQRSAKARNEEQQRDRELTTVDTSHTG